MKKHARRLFSLLLSLLMVLTLAPSAFMTDNSGGEGSGDQGSDTPGQSGIKSFSITEPNNQKLKPRDTGTEYDLILEPNRNSDISGSDGSAGLQVLLDPNNETIEIRWESSDPAVARVDPQSLGHTATIVGIEPGEATVKTAPRTAPEKEITIYTEVSGIKLSDDLVNGGLNLKENESVTLTKGKDYFLYGRAKSTGGSISAAEDNNKDIIEIKGASADSSITIEGRNAGTGMIKLRLGNYEASFSVTVTPVVETIEWKDGCSPSKPLEFSQLEEEIARKCLEVTGGGKLTSIVGLSVSTAEGIIYLGYKSPEDTGAGVGSSVTYYASSAARGPYIRNLTYVPNAKFGGEKAKIYFTGNADNNRSFKGCVEVTLTDEKTDLTVSTKRNTPLPLSFSLFSKVCQEQVGSPLDYVIFTLPPASQGALYRDYKDEWNYAAKISPNEKYDRKQLDAITFVPAETYVGEVRISYAGYSVSGSKYNGELIIQVKQGLDDAITYNDNGSGLVSFSRQDFDGFCENATGRAASTISFTLPPAAQGVLYLNWNGIRGAAVTEGTDYTPLQLDRMTFVAADGFHGVVRIPFSGTSRSGVNFSGTVELHIQSIGAGGTDASISYICAPGQSVKLSLSDFADLCQSLTGQRLHYINFQSLPDFNQGSLYHNRTSSGAMGTRATTAQRYFNSAAPYIANLSFWATNRFTSVTVPFTGSSVNGQTFTGTMSISSGAGAGSGSAGTVNYSAVGQTPVSFSGGDFDAACREATNAALSYLQFDLPSSSQGILYYDYRAGTPPTALNAGTTLYRSGETSVDRVSFVAAKGFSGVASVPFTGWAIDGRQFQGAVQITVRSDAALGGLVRYESRGEPVHINAYDIQTASGGTPASLRLTGLPDAASGKLYYQYAGPTQYSWQGNTSTVYSLYGDPSVSSLTFVPRAGFYGVTEIPYTASNADGTQYAGTIRITVTEPPVSANFDDLAGYSSQMKSAVDYLYSLGVVQGTGQRRYEPGASIRRGDFCVMLSRAFQFNVGSSVQGFSDVAPSAYYAQAVNEMYALGVVNGVGGGRFEPSNTLSRQDAALMVQRALKQAGISAPDGNAAALAAYGDRGQVAEYARGAVSGLVQLGLLPTSSGRLSPRSSLNRGDMALLLHRAMTQ